MDDRYGAWLDQLHPVGSTAAQYLRDTQRIETCYGDLDAEWARDELESVMASMAYSAVDDRNGESNPSKLPIQTSLYKTLASYRSCVNKYRRFRAETEGAQLQQTGAAAQAQDLIFRYEQDLQTALIACIGQIEPGLTLAENGKERAVPSGFIDVLARDTTGRLVVIELKAVTARREVLGQIAAYMADIEQETDARPRGILIAPDFDAKLVSGARMIEELALMRYQFRFDFTPLPV